MIIIAILLFIVIAYLLYSFIPTIYVKKVYRYKYKKNTKTIYLTFDDGPHRTFTKELLDVLDKYKVKASFFCVADFAAKNQDILERMKKSGHLIGIHSLKHENAYLMGITKTNKDFKNSIDIMEKMNIKVNFYRPPWGDVNLSTLYNIKKYNLTLVMWHVMADDWKADITSFGIEIKLLRSIKNGDIICLHDGRGENGAPLRTIEALNNVIPMLLKKGFVFETVDKYYEK